MKIFGGSALSLRLTKLLHPNGPLMWSIFNFSKSSDLFKTLSQKQFSDNLFYSLLNITIKNTYLLGFFLKIRNPQVVYIRGSNIKVVLKH